MSIRLYIWVSIRFSGFSSEGSTGLRLVILPVRLFKEVGSQYEARDEELGSSLVTRAMLCQLGRGMG